MTCKLGIFIPVYYREHLVEDCLNSLAKCFYFDTEVHIIIGIGGIRKSFMDEFLLSYKSIHETDPFKSISYVDTSDITSKSKCLDFISSNKLDFDLYMIIDSDITVFDRTLICKSISFLNDQPSIQCVSPTYCGSCKHRLYEFSQNTKRMDGYTITTTIGNDGVSTSCCIFKSEAFNKMRNMWHLPINRACFINGIHISCISELIVYHPVNNQLQYGQWIKNNEKYK